MIICNLMSSLCTCVSRLLFSGYYNSESEPNGLILSLRYNLTFFNSALVPPASWHGGYNDFQGLIWHRGEISKFTKFSQ